ncbi:MAG: efflux RND transporter permease subunit, partial [Flavobacteriales bacterium]|nr:efflux RND transporter permease subunit [Flavobacteriales bacterium]
EREKNAFEQRLDRLMQRMRHGFYEPFLERALRSPILAFGIFFFLLNLTFGALGAGWIQTTFFPVVERDDINVELEMVAGTREHIVNAELARIEDVIWRVNEELKAQREDSLDVVLKVQRKLGPRPEQGSLFVVLLDGETRDLKT